MSENMSGLAGLLGNLLNIQSPANQVRNPPPATQPGGLMGLLGLLAQRQSPGVIAGWRQGHTEDSLPEYFSQTNGGAATINPYLMAQGQRAAISRYNTLVAAGLINPFAGRSTTDSPPAPNRNILADDAVPWRGGSTIRDLAKPTQIPNVYRGELSAEQPNMYQNWTAGI